MIKTKKITRISQETHETLSVRRNVYSQPRRVSAWCEGCAAEVPFIALEEAIAIAGLSSRAIHRFAEDGHIHFQETPAGLMFVCPNSLADLPSSIG